MWVASYQSVFMGSCLTISHTYLPFLPSRRVSPCVLCPFMIGLMHNGGSVDVLFACFICRWEGGEAGKVRE